MIVIDFFCFIRLYYVSLTLVVCINLYVFCTSVNLLCACISFHAFNVIILYIVINK